jgi:hypothetical protein
MSDKSVLKDNQLSRRRFLYTAAKSGAGLGAVLMTSPAAAKVPPTAVNYQPTPKGKARCDNCVNWQAPSSCKFVDGKISPSGWCSLYRPKG